jgi:hypothetical protein
MSIKPTLQNILKGIHTEKRREDKYNKGRKKIK